MRNENEVKTPEIIAQETAEVAELKPEAEVLDAIKDEPQNAEKSVGTEASAPTDSEATAETSAKPKSKRKHAPDKKTEKAEAQPEANEPKQKTETETTDIVVNEDGAKVRKASVHRKRRTPATTVADNNSTGNTATATQPRRHILTIGESRSAVTERDKTREARFDILESMQSHKMLTDTVCGIELIDGKSVAVLFHGDIKIIIPQDSFIIKEKIRNWDDEQKHYHGIFKNHLGAEVDYYVVGVDRENNVAVGNRVQAMEEKRKRYYNGFDKNGNKFLYEGAICEARIVSIASNGMFVEVFGVETYIPKVEISYQRINYIEEKYRVGQVINVKIISLNINKNEDIYEVTCSAKQATENPQMKGISKYKKDNFYLGNVTMVAPFGIIVQLDENVECLCKYTPYLTRPVVGSSVTVKIESIVTGSGRIYGYIVHNSSSLF